MTLEELNKATPAELRARLAVISGKLAKLADDDSEAADAKMQRLADERRKIMAKLGM